MLINKPKSTGLKHFNDPNAFIEYSNDMDDIFKNIEEYNLNKERKIFIVFDDMISDMFRHKKSCPTVTELFIRGRRLNISLVFITQAYFVVPETIRLNFAHCFIMKIPNKREFPLDFQDFIRCTKMCYKNIIFFSDW